MKTNWISAKISLALLVASCSPDVDPAPPREILAAPVVAGVADAKFDTRLRGVVLLGELGCVACHADNESKAPADPRRGPRLDEVATRLQPAYLERFLAAPHATKPGTTMPDLLRDLGAEERKEAATSLLHYLRSCSKQSSAAVSASDWDTVMSSEELASASARGFELFHTLGCVACHAPRDEAGKELECADSVPLGDLAQKYTHRSLRAFLLDPLDVRPAGRMPHLRLAPAEAFDLASFLGAVDERETVLSDSAIDPARVEQGRALFFERGCAACHALADAEGAQPGSKLRRVHPLHELNVQRGCLSSDKGAWPFYPLSARQVQDLTAAIQSQKQPWSDAQHIEQLLISRQCTSCHERGSIQGIAEARQAFFTTNDPTLGEESRLPPPLSGVGAKLQPAWLRDAIAHGQEIRPYLRTRMPGFGAELAEELATLFERVDKLEPIELEPLPQEDKAARAVIDLGRELVGDKGMNCITCHLFASERVGTMAAVDLVDSTAERLRPEWFLHFLRSPQRFRPTTLMPSFFIDGRSTRPEIGDGDIAKQSSAIWHYLAEGRNVGKPSGMRRPAIELTVQEDAVLLRRALQNTGKRAISVGYPGGVNLSFDAERLGLNQIWWGAFLDASPVWSGQGSGQARILSQERVELPNGPAFCALVALDEPWPTSTRRELGQRFVGYELDERQRPSFLYECAGVAIRDTPREQRLGEPSAASSKPLLRRELEFTSDRDQVLSFLAARAADIEQIESGLVRVGTQLRIRVEPADLRIRKQAEFQELLIDIPLRAGKAALALEYSWIEEPK